MRTGLSKLLIAMALSYVATPLYADVVIVPAGAIFNSAKTLQSVVYLQPCGAKVLGVVIDKKTPQTIQMGVALSLPEASCITMPSTAALQISALKFPKATRFEPYVELLPKTPLQFSRVHNLKFIKQQSQLQIVHHRSCHAVLNSLPVINQTNDGISVGVLEHRRFTEKSCTHTQQTISLTAVLAANTKHLNTIQNQEQVTNNEALPYDLRLKSITTLSAVENRGLEVTFTRACDEAPVGVFVKKVMRRGQTRYLVAALAARFPDRACKSKKSVATTLHLVQLHLPTSQLIAVKNPKIAKISKLQVIKPQDIAVQKTVESSRETAAIKYFHDCDKHLGLVFASDRQNNLAVGILKQRASFRCTVGVQSRVLHQTFDLPPLATKDQLFPLNLENQSAI